MLLWITDPWNTLDHPNDTTLRLAEEALQYGITQEWCDVKTIRMERGRVLLDSQRIRGVKDGRGPTAFQLGPVKATEPSKFTAIHYRTDPPVDQAYLHPLHLLQLALWGKKSTEVVNPLSVLFGLNEKIEAAAIDSLMPPSIVSCEWEKLLKFGKDSSRNGGTGKTVLKPLHEAQSHGIQLVDWKSASTLDTKEHVRIATKDFSLPILSQRYLEEIHDGEVRLWYVDGKVIAYARKLPLQGDFRVDIDRGSQLQTTELTAKQKTIAVKVGKHIRNRKIRLAAVDLIGNYVTDFNFTSPGLVVQMEAVLGVNLARKIVDPWVR